MSTKLLPLFLVLYFCVTLVSGQSDKEYWPLQPIWDKDVMEGESLLFLKGNDNLIRAKLLFKGEKIMKMYSPSKGIVYEQGRDYEYDPGSGTVFLTENSRIPFKNQSDMYLKPGSPGSIEASRDGKNNLFFGEGHLFHDLQVEVDYVHKKNSWKGHKPAFRLAELPKTYSKLKSGQSMNMVIYGDSISTGANASAKVNVRPFMPSYPSLVAWSLEEIYDCKIAVTNLSKGGQVSRYGVENVSKVIAANPDLVIVAWGMNDGSHRVSPEEYGQSIKEQIDKIRQACPQCEFILVSTMCGNPEWTQSAPDLYPLYRDELEKLCGEGVVLADMTAIFSEILKHKSFWDITNNGVNHPNDFGHRLYAQTLLSLLVKKTVRLDRTVDKIEYPNRTDCSDLKSFELLKDRHFKKGFNVLSPKHGKYVEIGELRTDDNIEPVWQLAQWHSKFNILNAEVEKVGKAGFIFENAAKRVTLGRHGADITLYLNSIPEYDNQLRKEGQPWPHLLVEQKIQNCPNLSELKGLDFGITARVIYSKTFKKEGYSTKIHTAHVPYVLVVQNTNKKSPGYGDFIWFLVPIYDDRAAFAEPYIAEDTADPSAKMIYDPGARRYTSDTLHSGKWTTINSDLLPVILDALRVSWERGYVRDSRNLADYRIISMNLGWEVTGLNEVEIAIKNLSLRAVVEKRTQSKLHGAS